MRKFLLFFFLLLGSISVNAQYDHQNIDLVGHWYNPSEVGEPTYGIKYNSCWAWVDSVHGNHEYAILGSGSGTHIIDIGNPAAPVEVDFVAGRRNLCIWREYKTYGHYLYAVSDDGAPNSFQIIDMSYLPDSVHVVYDGTDLFERAHTIYINQDKMYVASVNLAAGSGYYSMAVFSLANPAAPAFLRSLHDDFPLINYAHDMLVRNDTVFASCGYQGLYIYKYNAGSNTFSEINSLTSYPDQGYNHSSTLSPDGKTLVFCDEVPANMAVKVIDISDITNINVASNFKSNEGATAHNPYFWGHNRVIIAYYQDGLQIFDVSNPSTPYRTGYFDTDTLHGLNDGYPTNPTYQGNWGAYVDLPSGLILASDMQNGLYILDAQIALGIPSITGTDNNCRIFPNPCTDKTTVQISVNTATTAQYAVQDLQGRTLISGAIDLLPGKREWQLPTGQLPSGMYLLKIQGKGVFCTEKLVRQ